MGHVLSRSRPNLKISIPKKKEKWVIVQQAKDDFFIVPRRRPKDEFVIVTIKYILYRSLCDFLTLYQSCLLYFLPNSSLYKIYQNIRSSENEDFIIYYFALYFDFIRIKFLIPLLPGENKNYHPVESIPFLFKNVHTYCEIARNCPVKTGF